VAGLYVGQAALNPLNGLNAIEKRLTGLRILHDKTPPSR